MATFTVSFNVENTSVKIADLVKLADFIITFVIDCK